MTSPEWARKTFERATYWNTHERCPNDLGPPERSNGPKVKCDQNSELRIAEEWERMREMQDDLIVIY